jgi:hypothetical protein
MQQLEKDYLELQNQLNSMVIENDTKLEELQSENQILK